MLYCGHAPNYAEVFAPFAPEENPRNEIWMVRILSSDGNALYGEAERAVSVLYEKSGNKY